MSKVYKGEDQRYHLRHASRSTDRAVAMTDFLRSAETILDVGCNRGVTSRHFLEHLPRALVTGIEISRQTVDPQLLNSDRFEFIEANVCDVSLPQSYDAIVYGAVHHHIFRERGLTEAVRVWRTLAAACKHQLFFETGHLTEGGRWAWQRAIRGYFRTDEEHIFYLLRCIEDRIRSFEVVGKFRIHGVRRWLIRISLEPSRMHDMNLSNCVRLAPDLSRSTPLLRSFGSRNQTLAPAADALADSPVRFFRVELESGAFFVKQALHAPRALDKEFEIGRKVDYAWAVRPLGRMEDGSLVFPWLDATRLLDAASDPGENRQLLADSLISIWKQCLRTPCRMPDGPLLPSSPTTRLADVVDLNPNNFLVEGAADAGRLRLVDFEPQSNHYRWKNRIHVSRMLLRLRSRRVRAILVWCCGTIQGVAHVLLYQLRPVEARIRDRQPAIASVVISTVRSWTGRMLVRLFPRFDEL